jgi:hypothetical protein
MAQRNLTGAKSGFDAIPAGWYPVILEQVEVTYASDTAKNPGAPMLKVVSAVREGDYAGRKTFANLMLDPEINGSAQTRDFLQSFGYDPDSFDDEEVAQELTGRECWSKFSKRMGKDQDGNPRMENRAVQWSSEDPGEAAPTKADAEQTAETAAPKKNATPTNAAGKKQLASKPGKAPGKKK